MSDLEKRLREKQAQREKDAYPWLIEVHLAKTADEWTPEIEAQRVAALAQIEDLQRRHEAGELFQPYVVVEVPYLWTDPELTEDDTMGL